MSTIKMLTTYTANELDKPRLVPPLIEGLLEVGESMLLFAASGVGKSMVAMGIASCIAEGKPFAGLQVGYTDGVPVLYVDGELGHRTTYKRLSMYQCSKPDNLHLASSFKYDGEHSFCNLKKKEDRRMIVNTALSVGAKLVVLDSLRTLALIENENDAAEFSYILQVVQDLVKHDISSIVVHHSGKSQDGKNGAEVNYSGSGNIATLFSKSIGLLQKDTEKFHVQFDVQKDRDETIKKGAGLELVINTDNKICAVNNNQAEESTHYVLSILEGGGVKNRDELLNLIRPLGMGGKGASLDKFINDYVLMYSSEITNKRQWDEFYSDATRAGRNISKIYRRNFDWLAETDNENGCELINSLEEIDFYKEGETK